MSQAPIDGLTFEFASAGAGDPVILIHGALIADAFLPLFSQPALASFRLMAYHRRGYDGSTAARGPVTISQQASDCRELMRYLGIARAHVVGHSFGGVVALQLALESPDLVHSLALLEPALMVGASAAGYRASLEQAMAHFHETEPSAVVDQMLRMRWPDYPIELERVLPGAFDRAVAAAAAAFDAELPGLLAWMFDEEQASRIRQPVLSVLGGESEALSPRFGEAHHWVLATFPAAEGYVLPGAHHFLQMENPSDMAAALDGFYSRHPLSASAT
jgi:pimeloyl-ACP methyl ester carboxylesterase